MTKNFLAAVIFLIGFMSPAGAKAQETHHTLWKVESPTNTLYLLGSIHLLKKTDYPLPAVIESAFSNSQVVVFETDVGKMDSAGPEMLAQFTLPAGQSLQDEISPKTYADLSNYLSEANLPVALVSQFKPAFAAFFLDAIESQKMGLDPNYGLDETMYKRARDAGKTIVPLEPLDFQIKLLTSFSKSESEALLKSSLADAKNTEKDLDEMLTAWKTGDTAKLDKLLASAFDDSPAIYKRLVTDRTDRWLPQIEQLFAAGKPVIVIVGAGHLVGDSGLAAQLRKKGFKVTQL